VPFIHLSLLFLLLAPFWWRKFFFGGEEKVGGRVGESEKVSEKKPKHAQKYSKLLQLVTRYKILNSFFSILA